MINSFQLTLEIVYNSRLTNRILTVNKFNYNLFTKPKTNLLPEILTHPPA